jgi:hypothetical protein
MRHAFAVAPAALRGDAELTLCSSGHPTRGSLTVERAFGNPLFLDRPFWAACAGRRSAPSLDDRSNSEGARSTSFGRFTSQSRHGEGK